MRFPREFRVGPTVSHGIANVEEALQRQKAISPSLKGNSAMSGLREQFGQPHQIVSGGSEGQSPSDAITATAGRFLSGRSSVDRRSAAVGVLCNMWRDLHRARSRSERIEFEFATAFLAAPSPGIDGRSISE